MDHRINRLTKIPPAPPPLPSEWWPTKTLCPTNEEFQAAQDRKRLAPMLAELQRLVEVYPDEIRELLAVPVVDIIEATKGGA